MKEGKRKNCFKTVIIALLLMVGSSLATGLWISEGHAGQLGTEVKHKIFLYKNHVVVKEMTSEDQDVYNTWVVEDEELVPQLRELFGWLTTPGYIPDNYIFKRVNITRFEDGTCMSEYVYADNDVTMSVIAVTVQEDAEIFADNDAGTIEMDDRMIFLWKDDINGTLGCTVVLDDQMIDISGNCPERSELIKIAENIY